MRRLAIGKSAYYARSRLLCHRDLEAIAALRAAHQEHPFYGVQRLGWHLGWSQHKARRIRTLAGIVVPRASKKRRSAQALPAEIPPPPNALKRYAVPRVVDRPQAGLNYGAMADSGGWVQDFTYLWFARSWHYLAAVLDLKTRQVVGWRLGTRHSSELTLAAIQDALSKYQKPTILHSDQGSEYLSYKHQCLCEHRGALRCLVLPGQAPGRTASWSVSSAVSSRNSGRSAGFQTLPGCMPPLPAPCTTTIPSVSIPPYA
jgi:putative transposase